jgi:GTP-binding protein
MPRARHAAPAVEATAADDTVEEGLPIVAILGRPNAGKSTLFNRLVRGRQAIVDSTPGVTRDRNVGIVSHNGRFMLLVDTGGFEDRDASPLAASVRAQADFAAESADVVILLVDGRAGVNPEDRTLMDRLRRLRKPLLCAVNKLDTPAHEAAAADFFALGIEEIFPLSTAHGHGVAELFDRIVEILPESGTGTPVSVPGAIRLAVIGRPNVGKSSLVNRLAGYERAIVDATPGTTRDSLDTPIRVGGRDYVLIDTAGIRRRPRVHENLERLSVVRALHAIERAHVAVLVVDATATISDQDARIAGYAWERRRALVVVLNKWDAVPLERRDEGRLLAEIRDTYPSFGELPGVALSAKTGARVDRLFPLLEEVIGAHRQELQTADLNRALQDATRAHTPPSVKGKQARFYYAAQTGKAPPEITIFTNTDLAIAPAYERYLRNVLRDSFKLFGTPLQLRFRRRSGDRAGRDRKKEPHQRRRRR